MTRNELVSKIEARMKELCYDQTRCLVESDDELFLISSSMNCGKDGLFQVIFYWDGSIKYERIHDCEVEAASMTPRELVAIQECSAMILHYQALRKEEQ